MLKRLDLLIEKLKNLPVHKPVKIISHFDTDGITSASIFSKTMQRAKKNFSMQIVKSLDGETIENLSDNNVLIFLDLASGSIPYLMKKKTEVIIIDHHELPKDFDTLEKIPKNIFIFNPTLHKNSNLCTAALVYLLAKRLSHENIDLSTMAVLGMVGDIHDQNLSKYYDEIIKDSNTIVRKGPLLYPGTRPLNKVLEYSSSPYIPNVTGSFRGSLELLREANIYQDNGVYKSLFELNEEEMANLITAIALRTGGKIKDVELVGNLYLIKFYNKQEDARELSALINACSRMDHSEIALGFCLGNSKYKEKAEEIYRSYKQHLVSALRYVTDADKILGDKYTIINARDKIKDTIIGTTASIISRSPAYEEGTIIIALAYNKDKIKVSARIVGREGRNVREVLTKAVVPLGGEVGGHPMAAGCLIEKTQESKFISELKKVLDVKVVNVKTHNL